MQPRLVAVEGPAAGRVFELGPDETGMGRSQTSAIVLPDAAASRRHCVIRAEAGQFRLTDLDSMHGTRVNGSAVKSCILAHGDRIQVGRSTLVLLLEDEPPEASSSGVDLRDGSLTAESTVRLDPSDALYLQPEKLLDSLRSSERASRDLNALLRIGAAVSSSPGIEALADRLLELIFEAVPAERGGILLTRPGTDEFDPTFPKGEAGGQPVEISRTVAEEVLREKVAVWSTNVLADEKLSKARSLASRRIRSLLCVPLTVLGRASGVIYLDTADSERSLDQRHLHLLTAIGAMVSGPLESARQIDRLQSENRRLVAETTIEHNMVGDSAPMREVYSVIARVSATDSTVLIRGESGTGKELAARAIHQNSPRAEKPFVAVNCAALTESLLESELFGHEKGAFTGAIARKIGKFEVANEGTLFLDEIGEMPPSIQVKLLRVLQEREFERVGGTRPVRVDIRLIAATNRDLEAQIREGRFRQDLYYRLNVVSFTMPPIRMRRDDILLLSDHFCALYSARFKRRVAGLSPEAEECLHAYDWPGNVRELQNAIERAVVMGLDEMIRVEDLPEAVVEARPGAGGASRTNFHEAVTAAKREIIARALEQSGGIVTEAARLLGLNSNYLHRLLNSLGLRTG
ncbi:MAG: sigma 54-interacting transcriptional regulator [Acidobacteriota bacterium]